MATMNQMKLLTQRALRCKYNIKFLSQPAMGKTTMMNLIRDEETAKDPEFFFDVWDGGTMQPTDTVMAMPVMEKKIIEMFRAGRLPNAYETPDLRGIIYVGEIALMGLETSRGFQKLWNHEDVGGFRIPDGVIFVGDGNRLTDKSGAQQESRANGSRYESHVLEYDTEYALNVIKSSYHERVAAFCIRFPANIDNYDDVYRTDPPRPANDLMSEEGKHGIWANLRSWKRVSDKLRDVEQSGVALIPGEIERNVGEGVGKTFLAFCDMLDRLSTLEEIIANPSKIAIPDKMDEQYALSVMLALLVNKDNWEQVATYMQRYQPELQTVFFRNMNDRLSKSKDENTSAVRNSKTFLKWITAKHITDLLRGASSL